VTSAQQAPVIAGVATESAPIGMLLGAADRLARPSTNVPSAARWQAARHL
jgi:hypothetical protein